VDVEEPALLEEVVNGHGDGVADPRDGPEGVRADAQMGLRAEELEGVMFLLHGVAGRVGQAEDADGVGLEFDALSLALAGDEFALGEQAAPGGEFGELVVVGQRGVGDDLQRGQARPVVDGQERETALRDANGANPSADNDALPGGHVQNAGDQCACVHFFRLLDC
jgi:hypothetical protein